MTGPVRTLTAIVICLTAISATATDRVNVPEGVYYYQPASSVFGSESIWINPAGLGRFDASGFQLMADYYNGNYAKSWGAAIHRDRISTAFRHVNNPSGEDFDEWLWGPGSKSARR